MNCNRSYTRSFQFGVFLLVGLLTVWCQLTSVAQESSSKDKENKPKNPVRLSNLKKYIQTLSSDEYKGREAGTDGARKAAGYIVDRLKSWNILPGIMPENQKGTPDYRQYFKFPVPKSVVTRQTATKLGANVIGILPGTDPEARKSCIVIGAHYDALGKGESDVLKGRMRKENSSDDVWNGADDNASGTAAVLEVARVLGRSNYRPDRTIVFAFFSAEEKGLHGSRHYIKHPARPLEQTVAMINLDMIGRNPDRKLQLNGIGSSGNWSLLLSQLESFDRRWIQPVHGLSGSSDHMPFLSNRIPSLFITAGLHNDYHSVRDEAEKISYKQVTLTTALTLEIVTKLANRNSVLTWNSDFGTGDASARKHRKKKKNSSSNSTRRNSGGEGESRTGGAKRIGIFSYRPLTAAEAKRYELDRNRGGVVILGLSKNSVGRKQGLKKGDVLYQINGINLPLSDPMDKLRSVLKKIQSGKHIPIRIYRNGTEKLLFLKF